MSIIDRVRSAAAGGLQSSINSTVGKAIPGLLGTTTAGALGALIRGGPNAAKALLPNIKAAPDLVLGQVERSAAEATQRAGQQLQDLLRQQVRQPRAGAPVPTEWSAGAVFGGLTLERYRRLFVESAMTQRAWKNLWFVSIDEFKASAESPAGPGPINLLAMDVEFAPCTMPGEAVNVGGANIDKLETTERVEIRLTTMDDLRGSLKRWFIAKCDQVAHTDGTMGLPADYLVVLHIAHMDPLGETNPQQRMHHKFLARPSNVEIQLSRRSKELEELPMAFIQYDTFMLPR